VIELLRLAAHENNATILVVAHDARIIPHVDRVFHLEDGKLVETGHELMLERHRGTVREEPESIPLL
jgi:ABC-type lipoprotein export system ATPase subunit